VLAEKHDILRRVLGHSRRVGEEYLFDCPMPDCDHHKPKLSVNIEKNAFKCWICDYHGKSVRRLIKRFGEIQHLVKWDELTNFEEYSASSLDDLFKDNPVFEIPQRIKLPDEFRTLTSKKIPLFAKPAMAYLRRRGLTYEDVLQWKIGFCNTGRYHDRIIIPSFDMEGYCNYFVARTFTNGEKYTNPPLSKDLVFNELFLDWNKDVVVVEGVFDALVAGNALPLLGSTVREESVVFQTILSNDPVLYLALDDNAQTKREKLIDLCLKYELEVYNIDTSGIEDIGSITKKQFEKLKKNAQPIVSEDYLEYKVHRALGDI